MTETEQPQTKMELAAYIVREVEELGFVVHPASRLARMRDTLQAGYIPFDLDDEKFRIALEAQRDMYQLRLIVDTMDGHREDNEFRESVHLLLKDSTLPQNDVDPRGRNRQFQLYLAAVCLNAGLQIRHAEPDVLVDVKGHSFGISAKRLQRLSALEGAIKKGARQIRGSTVPGIVALDLTMARNATNRPVISQIERQMLPLIIHSKNRQLFDEYGDSILRWVNGKGVLAILVFEFTLLLRADRTWGHDGMMCWFPTTDGEVQEAQLQTLNDAFLKGMPNLVDHTKND